MKKLLALGFPFLIAALMVGVLVLDGRRKSVTVVPVDAAARESHTVSSGSANIDPVCLMEVGSALESRVGGVSYFFCTEQCRDAFNESPESYLGHLCLVCRAGGVLTPVEKGGLEATWQDKSYLFCSEDHREAFRSDPAGYFMHTMWGIPNWLYYSSIALILVLSFGIIEIGANRRREGAPPRYDLFRAPWLRLLFKGRWTRFAGRAALVAAFLLIIAAGLFGNQLPNKNIAPVLTWTVWWGGLIWLVAYAGKAWCYVCPWDAVADWAEGLRFWGRKKEGMSLGIKWPKIMRNIWPATLLFIGLTWIEVGFGVTMRPRVTAWLGLAILGLAFASAFIFDRRSFCRYGCLVGRISGLYALFSPVEVRAADPEACRSCRTRSCYRGNGTGEPCPTFQYLGTMDQNTYCISCMECVKTCEHDNVALNLRPWGADLLGKIRARSDEAYLALIMLSLTVFHGLTMTGAWRGVVDSIRERLGVGEIAAFSMGMAAVMVAPAVVYGALVWVSRRMARGTRVGFRDYFIKYSYALLPIALFYHLAHNSEHLFMEGQKVIALLSDPFGWEWNLWGTADAAVQPLITLPTLWVLQVFFVMIGHIYSLAAARKAAAALFGNPRAVLRSQVPMLLAMILFSILSLWLLKQPMEMRTSAM